MKQDRRSVLKTMGIGAPLVAAGMGARVASAAPGTRATSIAIKGSEFLINDKVTYPGRAFRGNKIQGLLFTSRMVNCIINDQNPETRGMWAYRDGPWDPERNTREFIAALPSYRAHGLTSAAFNIQGGSPMGYGWHQPWHTSGYTPDGQILPDYRARLIKVLDALDANGMAAILGMFYISATPALNGEAAVVRACDEVTDIVCEGGYTNVMIEVGNEADIPRWPFEIIKPARSHELITRIQNRSKGKLRTKEGRLLVSTSFAFPTGDLPAPYLQAADYVLIHGNGMSSPAMMHARCKGIRAQAAYRGQPLLVNEDDHFDFDKPDNNMMAAIEEYCGWGYFDYRQIRDRFEDGYQSLPVDWGINSARKKGFFGLLAEATGSAPL
ncbi:MAG TPA: hypothetical protein VHZ32_18365 [Rhizomicrobium sp.]|jgi:hypothetical protein|nr:hypothetical protein [Rhizomicrobium sp.]